MCTCMCGYCTGSKFYQSRPNNVMLLKNAEAAELPMTHPSDFYCFKRSYHFLFLSLDKKPFMSCLVKPLTSRTWCQMLFLFSVHFFFDRISCSVAEIMSLARETMKARVENRPKQNCLIKDNLTVTSRAKSD